MIYIVSRLKDFLWFWLANCDDPEPAIEVASYDLEVYICINWIARSYTRLAQSVERQPFKLVAVGSSPTSGVRVRDNPIG